MRNLICFVQPLERVATVGDGGAEAADRVLAANVLDLEAYGRNVDSFMKGPGFIKGTRRYVPNSSPMSLYWEYLSFMQGRTEPPACWSSFFSVYRKIWLKHLLFRKGPDASRNVLLAKCFLEATGTKSKTTNWVLALVPWSPQKQLANKALRDPSERWRGTTR